MKTAAVHIGLVLAGGESRRMGSDKGLLPFERYPTLLHRQLSLLQRLPLQQVMISRHQLLDTPDDLRSCVISDSNQTHHDGPLAGIYAVARACPEATSLLVLPVDMPLMDQKSLSLLLETGLSQGCSLHYENEYFPLFLLLGKREREYLKEQLETATGNRSVHSLLHLTRAETLPSPSSTLFANTNTEDDWHTVIESRKSLYE